MFLANYADGLTDMPLPEMIQAFQREGKVAAFVCTPPSQTFHVVHLGADGQVERLQPVRQSGLLVNAGFFIFRPAIFDYMHAGEELVAEPFERLIASNRLMGHRYDRFWCLDTFKEQQELTDLWARGEAPWEVWKDEKSGEKPPPRLIPELDTRNGASALSSGFAA